MSKRKHHQPILSEVIGFNDEDLQANRKDALSKRQASSLRKKAGRWLDLYALAIVLGLAADAYVVAQGNSTNENLGSIVGKVAVISGITLVVLVYGWLMRSSELLTVEKQTIDVLDGRLHLYVVPTRYSSLYRLEIEGIVFDVSREMHNIFVDGADYRIYYSPVTKTILSVEHSSPGQRRQRSPIVIRKAKTKWSPVRPLPRPR